MQAKGKAEPLALFRPLAPRACFGADVTRTHATPLVGRELEKPLLIGIFERSAQQRSCQLVTIVGEPGWARAGSSPSCSPLSTTAPGLPLGARAGACPTGRGSRSQALGEIVKAGVRDPESDSPEEADAKLEHAFPQEDPDRPWLKARLAPLVGAPAGPASQEESFTAWRHTLEAWAEARETILVFEDLHWADEALPLPRTPGRVGGGGAAARALHRPPGAVRAAPHLRRERPQLAADQPRPLTDEETARLIASLLERAVLPAETQRALLERAGGNRSTRRSSCACSPTAASSRARRRCPTRCRR